MPYAGRIRNGRYTFEGKSFEFPVEEDGHTIHGSAIAARWSLLAERAGSVTLGSRLKSTGYPGVWIRRITYTIRPDSFSTECAVANVGRRSCPFVAGFHPTSWPGAGGSSRRVGAIGTGSPTAISRPASGTSSPLRMSAPGRASTTVSSPGTDKARDR